MSSRLLRFLLSIAIAFVFAGRMEAAAVHCRSQLARPTEAAAAGENLPARSVVAKSDMTMPGMAMADCPEHMAHHGAHHGAHSGAHPGTGKGGDPAKTTPCDCLTLLVAAPIEDWPELLVSIARFSWDRPSEVSFASIEPAPEPRPPRA